MDMLYELQKCVEEALSKKLLFEARLLELKNSSKAPVLVQ